jgi:hypothetical protein
MGKPSTWFNSDYLPINLGHALDYVTVIPNNRLDPTGETPAGQPARWTDEKHHQSPTVLVSEERAP